MSDERDRPKRAYCEGCDRPASVCLCPWLVPVAHRTPVLILRHASERRHALNTAKLLGAMGSNCTVVDGETFDPADCLDAKRRSVLLYPGEGSDPLAELNHTSANPELQLIVLDGTWRKTRLLFHLNPWLAELPRVHVEVGPTRYILRKACAEGVSTLEAVSAALSVLEPDNSFDDFGAALDQLMQFQREAMGEERFQKDFGA